MIALRPTNSTFYYLFTALQVVTPSVHSGAWQEGCMQIDDAEELCVPELVTAVNKPCLT